MTPNRWLGLVLDTTGSFKPCVLISKSQIVVDGTLFLVSRNIYFSCKGFVLFVDLESRMIVRLFLLCSMWQLVRLLIHKT
jgi:hypothetical protein